MLAEFKRDSARKELSELEEQIQEKRRAVEQLNNQETQHEEHQKFIVHSKQQVRNSLVATQHMQNKTVLRTKGLLRFAALSFLYRSLVEGCKPDK